MSKENPPQFQWGIHNKNLNTSEKNDTDVCN